MLKTAHYEYSPELSPRYKADGLATEKLFAARASTFELLAESAPSVANPSLVSSAFGPIQRILMAAPSYVLNYSAYSDPYEDLLSKLPQTTSFIVLSHASTRAKLAALLSRASVDNRTTVIEAPDSMRYTVWAEDAYAVTRAGGAGASYFVEPASFPRQEDALIADIVAAQTDIDQYHASLYYQGGNILIGDDYWLIGADYPNKSISLGLIQPRPNETKLTAVRRAYGSSLDVGRKLHLIGSTLPVPNQMERAITVNGQSWKEELYAGNGVGTVQPMFHIDMFVTPAGRDTNGNPLVLVGDPRLACQILNETLELHAMAPIYDDIAKKLKNIGFTVVRNPLPLVYQDDTSRRTRYWYFATANNALVEIDGTNKRVWFPSYGYGAWGNLAATDQANKQIWEGLGFTATMLGDFHPFAFNLGAAHCITKYVTRG